MLNQQQQQQPQAQAQAKDQDQAKPPNGSRQDPKQQQLPPPRQSPGHSSGNRLLQHVSPHNRMFDTIPFTEEEHREIRTKLNQYLPKLYVSKRAGSGGQQVSYIEGWRALNLANEIFGFNGWNSEIVSCQIDYLDTHGKQGRFLLGLSMVVRVTLRDGTFHEDIGYGYVDNCSSKAMAFEKCKKEALTDGIKRCLRCFGNLMGNCLYDKSFIKKLDSMKPEVTTYDTEDIYVGPHKIEQERRRNERIRLLQAEAASKQQVTQEQEMGTNNSAANAQPQVQSNLQQRVGVQSANLQQQQNSARQSTGSSTISVQSTHPNPQNLSNDNMQQQQRPQPHIQPTNQPVQINKQPPSTNQQLQQRMVPPNLQQTRSVVNQTKPAPLLNANSSAFVTPKLPNKHVDYVPTSKEADELDDSFLFSDDIPDGGSQLGHHLSPLVQRGVPQADQTNTNGGQHTTNGSVEEEMPENALTAFVAAGSARLLQEATTDPNEIPKFDPTFISPNIRRTVDPTKSIKTKRSDSPSPLAVNVNNHMVSKPLHNPLHLNMGKRIGMPLQPRQNRRPQLEGSPQPLHQQQSSNVIYPPPASIASNSNRQPEAQSANR